MTGVLNNADCMLMLTGAVFRASSKEERSNGAADRFRIGVETVNLIPGFNVVDSDKWKLCSQSRFAQNHMDTGIIVAGLSRSADEEASAKQIQKEIDAEKKIYEMERPKGAASILPDKEPRYIEEAPEPANL
jgi:hypothetical protein